MDLTEILLRADEPRRPLDWRFRRASALGKLPKRKRHVRVTDDRMIQDYADLLYRLREQESFSEMEKIRRRYPDLFRVHLAYATLNATELALTDALLLCRSVDPEIVRDQTGMNEVQQEGYRKMFLDVMDRRRMTSFIASQIMEPSKLRPSVGESALRDDLERAEPIDMTVVRGTFSARALRVIRLVGFYSSPVVVELLYSGMLADDIPEGRSSATRYISRAYLTNVRCRGMMSTYLAEYTEDNIKQFMKMAYALSVEESEEAQSTLVQNIDQWARSAMSKIVSLDTIESQEQQVIINSQP